LAEERATEEMTRQLIVVGSSAGGIDALTVLVGSLPAELPVPIVLAQHLDPRRRSHLPDILGRHTQLPIRLAKDHIELEPGTIIVLPPNSQATIVDHEIVLREPEDGGARPSIDLVLASAADVFGEGLVAVILTGTGSDGAAGARQVKAAGGTVIIQNPETAAYPGMPRSIAPTSVDIVADLETIGPLLHDLVTGRYVPSKPSEDQLLRSFLRQLRDESGIDFSAYKEATIRRRLQRRMVATSSPGLREYLKYIAAHPEEYQRLTSSFLIKVTEFFRDADLFTHLRDTIVPRLIEDARANQRELRLWSAGCATGEEAYSLAMLVCDALGDELDQFSVRIFATDLDNDAIAFARRGIYPASSLSNVPQSVIDRHFTRVDDRYEIRKRTRGVTIFGQHDLAQRAPFPRVDLTLCRNVLIYFTPELQTRALQLFAFSLRDHGYLVLGKAESTTPLAQYFVLESPRLKVYRRQGDRVLIPAARIRDSTPDAFARPIAGARPRWPESADERGRQDRPLSSMASAERLLLRLPVGVVVVDRNYDIQSINAEARNLLGIRVRAIAADLIHLLPDAMTGAVRASLDAAFRGTTTIGLYDLPSGVGADARSVEIATYPSPTDPGGKAETALILVRDVTSTSRVRHELEVALETDRQERRRLGEQAGVAAESNRQLLEANQDLTAMNAELRSANQELLVANEEVQAATEEVETLNEELQATNEELETLNEELQATVEELNATNDDLEARSVELQESAIQLAEERRRAEAGEHRMQQILDALPEAILTVDRSGDVVNENAAYLGLAPGGDLSLRDASGNPIDIGESLRRRAANGELVHETMTDAEGRRYLAESRLLEDGDAVAALLIIRRLPDG